MGATTPDSTAVRSVCVLADAADGPQPAGWAQRPMAYLAFGDTYAEEVDFARAHEWPVSVQAGLHLQMLHDPAGVGAEILRLEALLTA